MTQHKKRLRIVSNHDLLMKEAIDWYNKTYKTDFLIVEYIKEEVNFIIVEYTNASESQVFDLGRLYGIEKVKRNLSDDRYL